METPTNKAALAPSVLGSAVIDRLNINLSFFLKNPKDSFNICTEDTALQMKGTNSLVKFGNYFPTRDQTEPGLLTYKMSVQSI